VPGRQQVKDIAKGKVLSEPIPLTEYGPRDGRNFEFDWAGAFLQAHFQSDVGKKRRNNEDSCILCAPVATVLAEERGYLFAVADGMGGASAGEYASRMALKVLTESYYAAEAPAVPGALREALNIANIRVFEEAEINPLYSGMGTTVSALAVLGEWAYVAQVGDSRLYLLRERSGIHQVTRDHSLVAEQLRNGLISEEEARNHSLKNLITRAVGIKESVKVDLFSFHLQRGDTLLLCSDGLSNMVSDELIAATLADGDLKRGTQELIRFALESGGTDNVTVVAIRVVSVPPKTLRQPGAEEALIAKNGLFDKLRRLFQ